MKGAAQNGKGGSNFPFPICHQNQFQVLLLGLSFAEKIWDVVNSVPPDFWFIAKLYFPALLLMLWCCVVKSRDSDAQSIHGLKKWRKVAGRKAAGDKNSFSKACPFSLEYCLLQRLLPLRAKL